MILLFFYFTVQFLFSFHNLVFIFYFTIQFFFYHLFFMCIAYSFCLFSFSFSCLFIFLLLRPLPSLTLLFLPITTVSLSRPLYLTALLLPHLLCHNSASVYCLALSLACSFQLVSAWGDFLFPIDSLTIYNIVP